ncbi:DNA polymerase zeta [Friedmanniomyces endolithicus]|nr:DNA polymerase zeta [Friedmanniomyces endolithicus]
MANPTDNPSDIFRVRLNCHYQAAPTTLDPPLWDSSVSSTQPGNLPHLPVVRVFGATETGQKICAHIHGALLYLYIPYTESLDKGDVARYTSTLHHSIDHALALSYRRNSCDSNPRNTTFVAHISLVKGVPFFGYNIGYRHYLEIYLLNPLHMTRFADLLQQGAVIRGSFYEAHLQFLLQWMCDFNIYGCAFVEVDTIKALFHATLGVKWQGTEDEDVVNGPQSDQVADGHTDGLFSDFKSEDDPLVDTSSIAQLPHSDEGYNSDQDVARAKALTQRQKLQNAGVDGAIGETKLDGDADEIERRAEQFEEETVPKATVAKVEEGQSLKRSAQSSQGPFTRPRLDGDDAEQPPSRHVSFRVVDVKREAPTLARGRVLDDGDTADVPTSSQRVVKRRSAADPFNDLTLSAGERATFFVYGSLLRNLCLISLTKTRQLHRF